MSHIDNYRDTYVMKLQIMYTIFAINWIRSLYSFYASPMVYVRKKDGIFDYASFAKS